MSPARVGFYIAIAFAAGFFVRELVPGGVVRAQSGSEVYVRSVGDPTANKPLKIEGARVVGFSCTNATCFVATQ
jgi:hypothetical protein